MSFRFLPRRVRAREPAEIEPYAELAVTTNFSFLRGASSPEELVERARDLGLTGIGIADRNSVAGVVCALTKIRAFAEKEKERQENAAKKILSGNSRACSRNQACRWLKVGFLLMEPPIFLPIPATGPAGDGSRGCSHSGKAELKKATAFSDCRIFWIILKASILLSCHRRESMPSGLARFWSG